jgi:hypothetical protein
MAILHTFLFGKFFDKIFNGIVTNYCLFNKGYGLKRGKSCLF